MNTTFTARRQHGVEKNNRPPMELELQPLALPCDGGRPFVIAGPCSAETEEQVMTTATQLAAKGCHIFRAGVWKPRTKPGGFEGNGEKALPWLKRAKEKTGMLITTEVATPEHVELALKYGIDLLWIGARTTANPFAMQACRQPEGNRHSGAREKPCKPRPGTMDRCHGTYQPGRSEEDCSHSQRLLELRQETVQEPAHVADSHRAAPAADVNS